MFLSYLVSPAAQQLLCACITADMRSHIKCCACVDQLLCTKFFLHYMNKSFFGISAMNCLRSFSKNATVSLLKPCPFQVEVLVMRIQH